MSEQVVDIAGLEKQIEAKDAEFLALVKSGDVKQAGAMRALSSEIDKLTAELTAAQVKANEAKVGEVEKTLIDQIAAIVDASGADDILPEPVHTLIFTREPAKEGSENGPVQMVKLNPKKGTRKANTSNQTGTGTRKRVSNLLVQRTVNGSVEQLSVKDAIDKYYDGPREEGKAGSSMFVKRHWGPLFDKVNEKLEIQFEYVKDEAGENVVAS